MSEQQPPQPGQQQLRVDNDNMLIPYSDQAIIRSTPYGVSFDFMQNTLTQGRFQIVSRVGMSLDHAKSFAKALAKHIENLEKGGVPEAAQTPVETKSGFGFSVDDKKAS
jgi:hypothetical protein